jgi:hypothetical protein
VWERDAGGAADVAIAELGDEGEEEGEGESVDFVEEEDQGTVEDTAVSGEGVLEDAGVVVEIGALEESLGVGDVLSFEGTSDGVEQGVDTFFGVGEGFGVFEGAVEGVVVSGGVELVCKLLYAGGFAGLSCGVDEEVLLTVDEALEFGDACDGGEDVVVVGVAGAGDVEEFSHGCFFVGLCEAKVRKIPAPFGGITNGAAILEE